MCIYIYIYIEREREREREQAGDQFVCLRLCFVTSVKTSVQCGGGLYLKLILVTRKEIIGWT